MKNHELLDMIGDVNEDYVLEAGNNVTRPRFRWKTLAACAACAALVLAAYPVYRAVNPPLHAYTLMEGGTLNTLSDEKVPISGESGPKAEDSVFVGEYAMGEDKGGSGIDGADYTAPGQDVAVDEEAANQYTGLLRGLGGQGGYEPETYPDWYGGAWIDHGGGPDTPAWLTVSIVDSFRTDELEAQIKDWCGGTGDVLFCDAKYSLAHLYAIQDPVVEAVVKNGDVVSCGVGVDVMENCISVDIYSDSESVSDQALAQLAALDPDGDAIRVRVFTGSLTTFGDEEYVKGPAPVPGGKTEPVFDGARVEPSIEDSAERSEPASAPGEIDELPEKKYDGADALKEADGQAQAKYDVIYGEAE